MAKKKKQDELDSYSFNSEFNKQIASLLMDYTLSSLEPYEIPLFYRWLIGHTSELEIDEVEIVLDSMTALLVKAQPRFTVPCKSHLLRFKAQLRIDRAEQSNKPLTDKDRESLTAAKQEEEKHRQSALKATDDAEMVAGLHSPGNEPEED